MSLLANLLALTIVLETYRSAGQNPKVIVYTFIVIAFLRYWTVGLFLNLYPRGAGWVQTLLTYLSTKPRWTDLSAGGRNGKDKGTYFWGLFWGSLVMGLLMEGVSNAVHEETLDEWFLKWKWVFLYSAVYWVLDLLGGNLILDFKKSRWTNLDYNSSSVTVLFLSFAVGVLLAMTAGMTHSKWYGPWVFAVALLAVKHGTDLYMGYRHLILKKEGK